MKKRYRNLINFSNSWKFDKNVSKNFDQHVIQSIPFYKEFNNAIVSLSEFYMKENSTIYDLGCSTGNITTGLINLNLSHSLSIYAIDREASMLDIAKRKIKKLKKNKNTKIIFLKEDILKNKLLKNNLTICSLVFPFFKITDQSKLLKKIYNALEGGGAIIILDKIKSEDVDFETFFNQIYYDFKLRKKIKSIDITRKAKSLRSVHSLKSQKETEAMLYKSGFKKIENFFKFMNFSGFIAVK